MDPISAKIKPGECIWCRVESPVPGGYNVLAVNEGLKGFLPSTQPIEIGRAVPTTFVCMNGEEALFTFAFTMGTSARVQHSTASDEENAFSVWADAHPKYISLRRAVDLVMPPITSSAMIMKFDGAKAKEFFPTIEKTKFTGCMKVYCESAFSRAALIFLDGRVVGSIYTKKPNRDPHPFEMGIRKMLEDVTAPDADSDVEMYELPKEIILSMSSLFLGYVDLPKSQQEKTSYAEQMLEHFGKVKEIACFNLLDEKTDVPVAFGFICFGDFKGTYTFAGQTFSEKKEFLLKLLLDPAVQTKLQTHILPPAMTTDSIVFGYSLGSEHFYIPPH